MLVQGSLRLVVSTCDNTRHNSTIHTVSYSEHVRGVSPMHEEVLYHTDMSPGTGQ